MNFLGLLFILFAHFITGNGLLNLFNLKLPRSVNFALSLICGVVLISFPPFILQLFHIPITTKSVGISIIVLMLVLNVKRLFSLRSFKINSSSFAIKYAPPLYELIFIVLFILCMVPSVWKCFYFPPNARDIQSGPEIIAEYTVREHTMVNSVLSLNLESTNNHLKPPFITDLQIVYKLFVHPFGQLWLSVMVIALLIWLYTFLKEKLHPTIAGILLLLFIAIPDLYGYTYIILFDYSNMVLFFAGVYFLSQYIALQQGKLLWFSILMFGFATFIRSETLVLSTMFLPMFIYYAIKQKQPLLNTAGYAAAFVAIPYFFYFIWVDVFIKHYMPGHFSVANEINKNLGDVSFFFTRMSDMTTKFLYGGNNIGHYAYFINIFTILFLLDLIITRKLNLEAKIGLYALAVVYIGLPLLGYLLPLFDLGNTTKRGIFKMFPIMLLLLRNNSLLQNASASIYNWELGKKEPAAIVQINNKKEKAKKKGN